MKKIFFLILITSFSIQILGQTTIPDSTKTKLRPYVSAGISIGNGDPNISNSDNFNQTSYPSVEAGVMGKNLSLGAVFGCENFFVTSS